MIAHLQFLVRAFATDASIFVTSTSSASRLRDSFFRNTPGDSKPLMCAACQARPAKGSGFASLFSSHLLKRCTVCLQSVCSACADGNGWCGAFACTRCAESLKSIGLRPKVKKHAQKLSLFSSLRKIILPGHAAVQEKTWPREYVVKTDACVQLKLKDSDCGTDAAFDELQVVLDFLECACGFIYCYEALVFISLISIRIVFISLISIRIVFISLISIRIGRMVPPQMTPMKLKTLTAVYAAVSCCRMT
jgi:hypothetical protein